MTDALDTLLHEWAIPRMGVRRVLAAAFTGNDGSVKVLKGTVSNWSAQFRSIQ